MRADSVQMEHLEKSNTHSNASTQVKFEDRGLNPRVLPRKSIQDYYKYQVMEKQ